MAGIFMTAIAFSAVFFALIRGPHISNLQYLALTIGYAALTTTAFFGPLLYFWHHPARQCRFPISR
jgi:hypothetical protein